MTNKDFIDRLFEETSVYNNISQAKMAAALLNTVASDIYSESERFIFELVQNADDAALAVDNEVVFDFLPEHLIVSHNGKPFSAEDVKSLTSAGESTKTNDSTKTGYKGIGFKSVFGMSKKVIIFSGGFQFRFDKNAHEGTLPWQIIPIWTDTDKLSPLLQNSLAQNKHNVSTILEIENENTLEADLKKLIFGGQILLFLRKVSKITIANEGKAYYTIQKEPIKSSSAYNEVVIKEDNNIVSRWIVKTFENIDVPKEVRDQCANDEKIPDKLKEAMLTEISFAAKIDKGNILPLKYDESLIFTYLPTKVADFRFPFLVNGSFMTNASRESINGDVYWNKWLFGLIAEKTFEWLSQLSLTGFKYQVLHLLPFKFNASNNELRKSFNNNYEKNYRQAKIIVTNKEGIKTPEEVIHDVTGLSLQPFIELKSITDFIHQQKGIEYGTDCFVHHKLEVPNRLKELGIAVLELENLELFFISECFTSRHEINKNYELISYLKQMSDNDSTGEWFDTLRELPFIYSESEILSNPSFGICFPSDLGNTTELGEIPVIHPEVFTKITNDAKLQGWLKKLGVKEPTEIAYVTNVIIPNLGTEGFVNEQNYLQITFHLFKLYWEKLLDEVLLESLRELPLLVKGENISFIEAQSTYLSNRYRPTLPLEELIYDLNFVSENYLSNNRQYNEWSIFFKAIKVKDQIEIETIDNNNNLSTLEVLTDSEWVNSSKLVAENIPGAFGIGQHNVIELIKIPSFLNLITTNLAYSKVFWKNLLELHSHTFTELNAKARFKYGKGWGRNSFSVYVENYFPWFIKNKACLPTTLGTMEESRNVFTSNKEIKEIAGNYFPVLDYDDNITQYWQNLLNLKTRLDIPDYLKILDMMVEKYTEDDGARPSLTKIGLIYNKLASLLPDLPRDVQAEMSGWGKVAKLYSANGSFENVSLLRYITIDGFSTEAENFKVIYIPSNVKENKNFRNLLSVFGVQTVDKFEPVLKGSSLDFSLKQKLENILPAFIAVIEKKRPDEYSGIYDRIFKTLDRTEFTTAEEIILSFHFEGELVPGPSITVYRDESSFYFRGKWSKGLTMLNLVKELSSHISVQGFNEELGFLLREDQSEIVEWLEEMNVSPDALPARREFAKQKKIDLQFNKDNQGLTTDFEDVVTPTFEVHKEEEPEHNIEDTPFVPSRTAGSYHVADIQFKKKTFDNIKTEIPKIYKEVESDEVRTDIGYWSEEFVYKYLLGIGKYDNIQWVNQDQESGKPYDISYLSEGAQKYIDVKGTPSKGKDLIYISKGEWDFMLKQGENYSIMRVYDAGGEKPNIVEFENPKQSLLSGEIYPYGLHL